MPQKLQYLRIALSNYILLLQNESYFEAHEALEEAWHFMRKAKHPLQNLVKGLINASIAFEHLKRNRYDATRKAKIVMQSYERHKYLLNKEIIHHEFFDKACQKIELLKKTNEVFRNPML